MGGRQEITLYVTIDINTLITVFVLITSGQIERVNKVRRIWKYLVYSFKILSQGGSHIPVSGHFVCWGSLCSWTGLSSFWCDPWTRGWWPSGATWRQRSFVKTTDKKQKREYFPQGHQWHVVTWFRERQQRDMPLNSMVKKQKKKPMLAWCLMQNE